MIRTLAPTCIVLFLAVLTGAYAVQQGTSSPSASASEEQSLGLLPTAPLQSVLSDDGCHVAWLVRSQDNPAKQHVVVDGQKGPDYDGIAPSTLTFSADGAHFAYAATQGGGKWFVVLDGQEGPPYDDLSLPLVLGSNGSSIAYGARKANRWIVTMNGHESAEYDAISGLRTLSSDGKHVAYGARKGDKWIVVADGQEGPAYDGLGRLVMASEGSSYAYSALKAKKWVVNFNGHESAEYDGILEDSPTLSPDGEHCAFGAKKQKKWVVVADGKEGSEYRNLAKDSLHFSPNGEHFAYRARKGFLLNWVTVFDGREIPEYSNTTETTFSADGEHFAFCGLPGGKYALVVDGEVQAKYDQILNFSFSPDGKHFAYGAYKGSKSFVVVDGEEGPQYRQIAMGPVFSPDGKRIAYAASTGKKWVVVVDGQASPEYDGVSGSETITDSIVRLGSFLPNLRVGNLVYINEKREFRVLGEVGQGGGGFSQRRFSSDGSHFAYWARRKSKMIVVADGREGPEYDAIVTGGPVFRSDGTLEYLALRREHQDKKGVELVRVKHPLGETGSQ